MVLFKEENVEVVIQSETQIPVLKVSEHCKLISRVAFYYKISTILILLKWSGNQIDLVVYKNLVWEGIIYALETSGIGTIKNRNLIVMSNTWLMEGPRTGMPGTACPGALLWPYNRSQLLVGWSLL